VVKGARFNVGREFSPDEVKVYYTARVPGLKQAGVELRGPCPVHNGKRDSFAVDPKTGFAYCHSHCVRGWDMIGLERELTGVGFAVARNTIFQIVGRTGAQAGSSSGRIVAVYDYTDETGLLLYQTVRFDPKDFRQRRPDGNGGWIWNLRGIRHALYRLPQLLARDTETVFICEGEKDVDAIEELGLLATCNPMGAGKWRDEYAVALQGRQVVVITDNDPSTDERSQPHFKGQKHAGVVAESLLRHACEVRILELPRVKDASEWLADGGTLGELRKLVDACPILTAVDLKAWRARWQPQGEEVRLFSARVVSDEWPEPLPLQSELPPVETFSDELLPVSCRSLVGDVSERMQVPIDYPAVVVVLALAGVVNRRATIQPKANDPSWIVVPNLWGGLIAPPGFMKSPVIQAATRPLNQLQSDWRREHQSSLTEHARAIEECELARSAWRDLSKAALKKGKTALDRPPDPPSAPLLRRLIVNDATFEAMHQTMSENPAGILVIRDELTGWWSQLDRVGREGERAFCLQAWNGDTGHTIDRIGRGTIHVEACCMSMLGGIQPGRLRSYLAEALSDGPSNDGLIQRFQLLVWPDTEGEWKYVDRPPDASAEKLAGEIFRKLAEIDAASPMRFRFGPQAQELFVEWFTDLEVKLRGDEIHSALVSHLSKYRKLMPALALLFELADRALANTLGSSGLCVSLEHAARAAEWCSYLESHARRIYSCVTTPQMRAAQVLAQKIKNRKVGADGFFTHREVYVKGWSGLDTPEAVKLAAHILLDACWIREQTGEVKPISGRPSNRYQVNPRIWK